MKIEAVDLFYLAMPTIHDIGDGSQDALLVRVQAGDYVGWGECEASPLVSIANWCTPMSHAACKPVRDSVLGQTIDSPDDIRRIHRLVRTRGLDIAQTDHTLSGIDIALWDLLGKRYEQPVFELLGYKRAHPKRPYASQLFGDTPEQTYAKACQSRTQGYQAVKFGWGPYGTTTPQADRDHVAAAREGLGDDVMLMVDAGTVWGDDIAQARQRLDALQQFDVLWLEEPFVGEALAAHRELAQHAGSVKLAGGEGARNVHMAQHLIDHGDVGYIQVDTGRIGGITPAYEVARYAASRNVTYVNHTFTTHLALSASLQPFAGLSDHELCEYPVEATDLATRLTCQVLSRDQEGCVEVPDAPGLGVEPNLDVVRQYQVEVEIRLRGREYFRSSLV